MTIVSALSEADYRFLSEKYQIDESILTWWDDAQWAEFLECEMADLPYLLYDDATLDAYEEATAHEAIDLEQQGFWEDDNFTIDAMIEEQLMSRPTYATSPAQLPSAQPRKIASIGTAKVRAGAKSISPYSQPSIYGRNKGVRKPTPHHFEVIH